MRDNKDHNVTPETIQKEVRKSLSEQVKARQTARKAVQFESSEYEKVEMASQIEKEMLDAAEALNFERAAMLRDQLRELRDLPELIVSSRTKKEAKKREKRK